MIYYIWHKLTKTSRSVYLLASLVMLIFVYPVLSGHPVAWFILGLSFAFTPVTGLYAVSDDKKSLAVATILAVPAIASIIAHFFFNLHFLSDQLSLSLIVVYYFFTTISIIRHIFKKRDVDADTIISAVSGYLMIGLSFAVAYMLVHLPSSAMVENSANGMVKWHDTFYFSIVTLTTLGYGDISPTLPVARSLASLEAVCGVVYMSVLIAKLVSEYKASSRPDR